MSRKSLAPPLAQEEPPFRWTATVWLAVATLVMVTVRLYAATVVGFGDSEALYAAWAAHPQPVFVDHPGLVGVIMRVVGGGGPPSPARAHAVSSLIASAYPWLVYACARAFGSTRGGAAVAGLVVASVPETAVGLFALTPDLVLAPAWVGALALAAVGLRGPSGSNRSAFAFLAAGLLAGVACTAKVSALLLVASLLVTYTSLALQPAQASSQSMQSARLAARTMWPWAGILVGLVTFVPVLMYEARAGFPMLRHRFVDTQPEAGIALKNVAALLSGQLLYLSPVFAVLAWIAGRDLVQKRAKDLPSRILFFSFAIPLLPLLLLCVWSPVAEPHWIAPALLSLPLHAARRIQMGERPLTTRRVFFAAISLATATSLFAHVWVLVPGLSRILPSDADPKLDIANELYGWPTAIRAIREQTANLGTPFDPQGREVVVVGPHWTICAQIHAALPDVRVGCATPIRDDFDTWLPREQWRSAEQVLFVTDNRFPGDGHNHLPAHVQTEQRRVRILRAGRTARAFDLFVYDRRAQGLLQR